MSRLASRLARPATLALLAGALVWAWAARALWTATISVPDNLPDLSAERFFSSSFLDRSATYERFLIVDSLLAIAVLLIVLGIYAKRGHRLMRESAAGRVGTGMMLGMLGFAVVWLAQIPFGLAAVWWQRRYEVSHQGYLEWIVGSFLQLGGTFLFVSVALAVAMGLAGLLPRLWWLVAAPLFVALTLLFAFVSPYLIPNTSPLRDPELLADARALERREGVSGTKFVVEDVHRFTTAPNAEATGIGPTRTVVLWDTLVDDFSRAEVRSVLGHEVAHLAHDDSLRRVGWLALFLIPAAGLIAFFTRGRGGMARPEAVPVALFVLIALQLLATPLFNAVSRRDEAAADWASLQATGEPGAARNAQRELTERSKQSPDPPSWTAALFGSHPTAMQRIAMTYAWEERRRRR